MGINVSPCVLYLCINATCEELVLCERVCSASWKEEEQRKEKAYVAGYMTRPDPR